MRVRRSRPLALIALGALIAAGPVVVVSTPAGAAPPAAAPAAKQFPPRANSAWVYDTTPGSWVADIARYKARATRGHTLNQVYSYAADMEMYCPDNDGTRCTPDDLVSVYDPSTSGWAQTGAYHDAFHRRDGSFTLSPIIDGRTDAKGYLQGFNELSPSLAAAFADKVAAQVCADDRIDGIQFDLEPFDVTSANGQFHFYLQLAKDFAGRHAGSPRHDPYGCTDRTHPRGRFWSVFTFAASIRPGTASATNVRTIMNAYGNGYLMDSLYDLSSAPAGTLNGVGPYRSAVLREALQARVWSQRLGIRYGYGIPASASAHEFTTCTAGTATDLRCVPDRAGATGYPMIDYTSLAVHAVNAVGAPRDPRFIGTAIWDFGASVSWNGLDFTPSPAPRSVLDYLATRLPGAICR